MHSAILTELEHIELKDTPMPKIKTPTQVLIKVKAVGICGTDLHMFKESRADVILPRVMGHELSGQVVEIGNAVSRVSVNDRVVLDPVFACGNCSICKKGYPNVCKSVSCFGVQMDGGFCEYIAVDEKHIYKISDSVPYDIAALAEPFSIASNILERVNLKPDETVLILGAGTIGLAVLQVAKMLGAKVMITDISEQKLDIAKSFGADMTVISKDGILEKGAFEFSNDGFDIVIDAVGIAPLLEKCLNFATSRGRIACIGFDSRPAKIPPVLITKKELSIIGSRMNCGRFSTVVEWLNSGKLKYAENMITGRYPLEKIETAFKETLTNSDKSIKTVILTEE